MDAMTLYSTWPDTKTAEEAARSLLEQRLIACANILPGAVSVYRWGGDVQRDSEVVMVLKTTAACAQQARDALLILHPYDTPCITALNIDARASNPEFLAWLAAETT